MTIRNALVGVLAAVATLSVVSTAALAMVVRSQNVRIDGLAGRVELLESQYGYHEIMLDAHGEALVDWYKVRRVRAEHWGSAIYWAEKAAEMADAGME
ncbi:MAG: hypothetical protein ACREIS_05645 [Nitrospiraceae bacterium]